VAIAQTLSPIKYDVIVKDPLSKWIDKLSIVESGGRPGIKILDSNNKYSYGCMQFQMDTFRSYVRKYDLLPEAEDLELENWIYDCEFQKYLAHRMISEDPRNINHWKNSLPKIK